MASTTRTFHRRLFGAGLVATAAGWSLIGTTQHPLVPVGLMTAGLLVTVGTVYQRLRPATGSGAAIARYDRHTGRHTGTASRWDIFRTSSGWAMRRKAAVLRPSLRGVRWWR